MDDYEAAMSRFTEAANNLAHTMYLQRQMRWLMSYNLAIRHILTFEMANPTFRVDQCSLYAAMNGVLVSPVQIYSLN